MSSESTTSLTRQFDAVDPAKFLCLTALLAAARAAVLQPLNVALTRVRSEQQQQLQQSRTRNATTVMHELRHNRHLLTRGMPAFVVGAALTESCYLFYFEFARSTQHSNSSSGGDASSLSSSLSQGTRDFLSGFTADCMRQVMVTPFAVISTRQILAPAESAAFTTSATMRLLLTERRGVRAFYSGLGTSLTLGPLWTASWWWLYGQSKVVLYSAAAPYLQQEQEERDHHHDKSNNNGKKNSSWLRNPKDNVLLNTTASVFASAVAAAVFNPFLVVRTRVMAIPGGGKVSHVIRDILRSSSSSSPWRVLTAGTVTTVAQSVVDGILASLTYEQAKLWSDRTKLT